MKRYRLMFYSITPAPRLNPEGHLQEPWRVVRSPSKTWAARGVGEYVRGPCASRDHAEEVLGRLVKRRSMLTAWAGNDSLYVHREEISDNLLDNL